jgi:hypothetical protein
MPMGPEGLGFVYFATVKFAGYTAAASYLKRKYPEAQANPWLAGGVRTLIGVAVGFAVVFLGKDVGLIPSGPGFFVLLVPIRILEWLLLLYLFFERPSWTWQRAFKWSSLGTVWSFALDLPAILAMFVIPGGAWIC